MAQDTTVLFAVAGIAFVLVLFLVGFLFMIFDSLDDAPASKPTPTTSSHAGAAGKPVNMTSVFGGGSGKKRQYSIGVRLEEFLKWSIKEAPDALVAYCSQMEGDDREADREALFTELPKVINHVFGLDRGPDLPRGWLVGLDRYVLDGPDKNDKDAQHIGGKLLDLLSGSTATTPNNGGGGNSSSNSSSSSSSSSRGRLFEKLVDPGRGPESGISYQFPDSGIYANMMPQQAQLALKTNRDHLVPRFLQRIRARAYARERIQAPYLILNAWEYYLFCFCLWPLSDAGDRSLGLAPPTPTGGANAATSLLGRVGVGPARSRGPMYHQLLGSYLEHFVPAGQPMKAEGHGELLLEAIAQFWVSQNAFPAVLAQFGPLGKDGLPCKAPPGSALGEFKETNASILGCLDKVVTHLNLHESKRRAEEPSAHRMLMPHLYHYFSSQMSKLPDISSRVIQLARLLIKYLEPWRPPPKVGGAAAGGASSGGGGGGSSGASGGGASGGGASGGGTGGEGSGGHASLLESAAARPVMTAQAKARLAESWEWAGFVRDNYFLYVRVLVRMANEVKGVADSPTDKPKPRFMMREQKRDREMLAEFAALFGNDKLLTLMKGLGEALEQYQNGTLPASAPEYKALVSQLQQLEPLDQSRWQGACADYTPRKVYEALDGMDEYLQQEQAIMKKEQAKMPLVGMGAATSKGSPMAVVDELRRVAQKAMRELQPEGSEVVVPRKIVQMAHPPIGLLDSAAAATPLSADEKDRIRAGRARCSALNVGYRATPRLPVRPVGKYEVTSLVELAEAVANQWPAFLKQRGLHPRFLANIPSLLLCAVYAFLVAVRPTPSRAEPEAYWLLLILWLLVLAVSLALGALYLRHWARRHKPSLRATAESWVPWVAEQLQRGVGEPEIKEYLLRTALPSDSVVDAADEADNMLKLAKRRARWSHN